MSETRARPSAPRGRGSSRGGRISRSGPRSGSRNTTNGDYHQKVENVPTASPGDEGELGELKQKYSAKLRIIKDMIPSWTDEDIVFALREMNGDLEGTISRITEGSVSQWGEVKKKSKDRSRSKVKEPPSDATNTPSGRGARGGRGGTDGARGGRGRGSDRGRRGGRGGSSAPTNGLRQKKGSEAQGNSGDGPVSIPTEESPAWVTPSSKPPESENSSLDISRVAPITTADGSGQREVPSGSNAGPTEENAKGNTTATESSKKTWASMFAKPATAPVSKKAPTVPSPQNVPPQPALPPIEAAEPQNDIPPVTSTPADPETAPVEKTPDIEPTLPDVLTQTTLDEVHPPKNDLTETNLEKVLDTSAPAPTTTVASTIDSTKDSRSGAGSISPFISTPSSRPATSGYAASAHKATGPGTRTSSFQRRVLDQREAVVMPGNHAVDRAAVQFGSLGLNGADDSDVDEDREEAETRTQPPQHSPVAHPVASLPPAPQNQPLTPMQPSVEAAQAPPGLPAAPHQQAAVPPQQPSPQPPHAPQSMTHQTSQYGPFGRYGQQALSQDQPPTQKQYESLHQQAQPSQQSQPQPVQTHATQHAPTQQQQYENYPGHNQAQHTQPQHHQPTHAGAFSSAGNEYSSYYTSDQNRGPQTYYTTPYTQGQQDAGAAQQRSSSGFGGAPADPPSQFSTTQAQQTQPRYGQAADAHTGGHTTPNPTLPGQQQQSVPNVQPQQPHLQHPQSQAGGQGAYPYGHPYYPYQNSAYAAYLSQVGVPSPQAATKDDADGVGRYGPAYLMYDVQFSGYNSAYGAPFGGKGAMYGQQPHQGYGISPQTSFEHSSTPANIGGFGQPSVHTRDSAVGTGLADYGRSGSAQPAQTQQHSATSGPFGMDVFGRSGFQAQNQQLGQQQNSQQGGSEDSLKPFSDSKPSAGGPSPSLNQPGRPGSATNNTLGGPGQTGQPGQTTLPPQSQSQPGFGGYPSHHLHGSQAAQYGGLTGLGGHGAQGQNHQNSGYGNYGAGFGSGYYGSSGRGGWGGNYGGH
ncbi:MAG: hypothetical protein M1840_001918 [Geoglossum simile]|nr:MAG: hypothetical protein M1840_001918 [Geoglossum simile]